MYYDDLDDGEVKFEIRENGTKGLPVRNTGVGWLSDVFSPESPFTNNVAGEGASHFSRFMNNPDQ